MSVLTRLSICAVGIRVCGAGTDIRDNEIPISQIRHTALTDILQSELHFEVTSQTEKLHLIISFCCTEGNIGKDR